MTNLLTGLDKLIADVAGPLLFGAGKIARQTRVSDGRGGWSVADAYEACQALVVDYSAWSKSSLGIPDTDRKVMVLGHGLASPPIPGNVVIVDGYRWVIVATTRDPAKAVYECQCRPDGADRVIARSVMAIANPVLAALGKLRIAASGAMTIAGPLLTSTSRVAIAAAAAIAIASPVLDASASVFSPEMLFAASEAGAFYDPSDLTSLYQARTGGGVVTTRGQTVGIMLDKSRMGGKTAAHFIADQPDLVPPGVGDGTSLAAWALVNANGALTLNAGRIRITNATGSGEGVGYFNFSAQAGKTYACVFLKPDADQPNRGSFSVSGTGATLLFGGTGTSLIGLGDRFVLIRCANTATIQIRFGTNSTTLGNWAEYDDIQIKEVEGFHAIAPSDSARPLYMNAPDPAAMQARPELLSGGDFSSSSGWSTATWTITGGRAEFGPAWAGNQIVRSDLTLEAGKTYLVTGQQSATTGIGLRVDDGVGQVPVSGEASFYCVVTMQATRTFRILATSTGAVNQWIDNLSVKEIPPSTKSFHFLQPDGVDDRMQVLPVCNLGETWAHVGGWKAEGNALYPFATSSQYYGALRYVGGQWIWYDSAIQVASLSISNPSAPHVATIEQASTASLSARFNGVAERAPIVPADDTAATQGLGLFSNANNAYGAGWNGRFFGGAWINRSLTTAERRAAEVWQAQRTGVAL